MNKTELETAVQTCKSDVKDALQLVYDELNKGQQKKVIKNEQVKYLFDLYGVEYSN